MKNYLLAFLQPGRRSLLTLILVIVLLLVVFNYLGFLEPFRKTLNTGAMTYKIGAVDISFYRVISGLFGIIVLSWAASFISGAIEKSMARATWLEASMQDLLVKVLQVFLYFILIMLGLNLAGIDPSTFAVFGGALGVSIGLGLQKISANFVSGIILLLEKSVKKGDRVELSGGIAGIVRNTGIRYTLIDAGDGREIMVPNEEFITNRITNWTLTDNSALIEIKVSVSAGSDLDLAQKLMRECASAYENISHLHPVNCTLQEFAGDSLVFSLGFWVDDITRSGRVTPRSEVMLAIARAFRDNGIEMSTPKKEAAKPQ
ncbi:MAG: mechanosensitive ion channel family protein [Pseudomonadota bacterium]